MNEGTHNPKTTIIELPIKIKNDSGFCESVKKTASFIVVQEGDYENFATLWEIEKSGITEKDPPLYQDNQWENTDFLIKNKNITEKGVKITPTILKKIQEKMEEIIKF